MTQTVLITGGCRRIGLFFTQQFLKDGWRVIAHYHHDSNEVETLKQNPMVFCVQANFEEEGDIQNFFSKIPYPVDCLINNASTYIHDSLKKSTKESWDAHMMVNVRAPLVLSQCFAQHSDQASNIINIIDQKVINLFPSHFTYSLSKFSLYGLTQLLARELSPQIRVNAIGPGLTLPNSEQSEAFCEAFSNKLPLKKRPTMEDCYRTIQWILNTPSLTGTFIPIDSGQHMGWSFPK